MIRMAGTVWRKHHDIMFFHIMTAGAPFINMD